MDTSSNRELATSTMICSIFLVITLSGFVASQECVSQEDECGNVLLYGAVFPASSADSVAVVYSRDYQSPHISAGSGRVVYNYSDSSNTTSLVTGLDFNTDTIITVTFMRANCKYECTKTLRPSTNGEHI